MTYILIRKAILENAETRHGNIEFKPGEAMAVMNTSGSSFYWVGDRKHVNGLFLEEITESQYETYELFGIPTINWKEVATRRDDFNSYILLNRIDRALKRKGKLS